MNENLNNKGFTVVELLVSFALTMLVMGFLFEVVVSLKSLYNKTEIQTELLNKQGLISKILNEDFDNKTIDNFAPCDIQNNCYNITYTDGTVKKISIENEYVVKYGDTAIKLDDNNNFGNITFKVDGDSKSTYTFGVDEQAVMSLSIPIINTTLDKNFDVLAIYQNNI